MQQGLQAILEIQEYDMKMIRLMRLKRDRQKELQHIATIKRDLQHQIMAKESEILELKKTIRIGEGEIEETKEKIQQLDEQQGKVKKLEEFNALTQEMSTAERQRVAKEARLSDLYDQLATEEDVLKSLQESAESTSENSKALEKEIADSIANINVEGQALKKERDVLAEKADPEILAIYERLLRNKRDRVVVPIENRSCSGCHIMLTAQHENLVRKGEKLVFCEHCSRIHYWQDTMVSGEGEEAAPKRRRRRSAAV